MKVVVMALGDEWLPRIRRVLEWGRWEARGWGSGRPPRGARGDEIVRRVYTPTSVRVPTPPPRGHSTRRHRGSQCKMRGDTHLLARRSAPKLSRARPGNRRRRRRRATRMPMLAAPLGNSDSSHLSYGSPRPAVCSSRLALSR